jgi:hypothetical protein
MRPDLLAERRACHAGIRARIQLVAHECGLCRDEIKAGNELEALSVNPLRTGTSPQL